MNFLFILLLFNHLMEDLLYLNRLPDRYKQALPQLVILCFSFAIEGSTVS